MPKLTGPAKAADLQHHYVGGICGFKEKGSDRVDIVNIQDLRNDVTDKTGENMLVYASKYVSGLWKKLDAPLSLKDPRLILTFPKSGFVNTEMSAVYFKRLPIRQWLFIPKLHGNCATATIDAEAGMFLLKEAETQYVKQLDPMAIYSALYNREFPHFAEILGEIRLGKRLSGAFAIDWAMAVNTSSTVPILYYKNLFSVGFVRGPDQITLHQKARPLAELLSYSAPVRISYE